MSRKSNLYKNRPETQLRIKSLKALMSNTCFRDCRTVRDYLLKGEDAGMWEDYHIMEIAAALGVTNAAVSKAIQQCDGENGVTIHCIGSNENGTVGYSLKSRIERLNRSGHWKDMTRGQMARELGVKSEDVTAAICKLWKKHGIRVDYRRRGDSIE